MAQPVHASGQADGKLSARPSPGVPLNYSLGATELRNGALLYRPSSLGPGPHPLIVLVHGYPQPARDILRWFEPIAEREQLLLLALKSRGQRWDLVPNPEQQISRKFRPAYRFGPDVGRTDAVLKEVFANAPVDPARVVLLGFSDGASYALSLGLVNFELFNSIIALSPGFVKVPTEVLPAQRIVVASGTFDTMLPYGTVANRVVPLMVENQLHPLFCSFEGGHAIHLKLLSDTLGYALRRAPAPSADSSSESPFECVAH